MNKEAASSDGPEEPIFPIEEFVGDGPKSEADKTPKPVNDADLSSISGATPSADATQAPSVPPSAPATASVDSSVASPSASPTQAPPVPKDTQDQKGKASGILSFLKRKQTSQPVAPSSALPNTPGSKAVIKRSSGIGKIILILLGIIVVLAAVFFLFFYKVTIDINTNPAADTILIDSQPTTPGKHKLNPGFHDIKIEKAGYVSYYQSRKFSIGEKLSLSFNLQKAQTGSTISSGAKSLNLSTSGKYIDFLGQDSRLYTIALDDPKTEPVALSLEQFPPIRQIKFSQNNDFALILDEQALRIADFARLDPTTQEKSTALPPAASGISSIAWNNNKTAYVSEANSKILYDLKTATSWDLMMLDRGNNHSQIVMRIDSSRYPKINIDWGDSERTALLTGNEAGLLDLGTREYTALQENGGFTNGKWAPGGTYAILTKTDGEAYLLKDGKLNSLNLKAKTFIFKSKNEGYFIEGDKVVLVNFDTGSRINYAEISGLSKAVSFTVYADTVYFLDNSGIKNAKLQQGAYEGQARE